MSELHPVLKKLQLKDQSKPALILNAPKEYKEIENAFEAEVHHAEKLDSYAFVQVFGTSNEELQNLAKEGASVLEKGGLIWVCYPKKSSKTYKGSDCSRDKVAYVLADEGLEPVRQVAIDEDWSALRFRPVEDIKTMTRKFAATEKGKERTNK